MVAEHVPSYPLAKENGRHFFIELPVKHVARNAWIKSFVLLSRSVKYGKFIFYF